MSAKRILISERSGLRYVTPAAVWRCEELEREIAVLKREGKKSKNFYTLTDVPTGLCLGYDVYPNAKKAKEDFYKKYLPMYQRRPDVVAQHPVINSEDVSDLM
jgi:hypothetical protein